jgi:choline dehydrogenase-like flavoprotein
VIVVGAGAGGCVAAARLFDAGCAVHLIEAGDERAENASIDLDEGLARVDLLDDNVFVSSFTGGTRFPYVRGRALGGTTAINALIQMCGTAEDWNLWSDKFGCTGWNWNAIRREIASLEFPMHVVAENQHGPLTAATLRAAQGLGASRCRHVGETADGAGSVGLSIVDGRRADAFSVFIAPRRAADPERLVVSAASRVREIAVTSGRAKGVVLEDDTEISADAVVVCAGAVWSPILLRRSGVSRSGLGRNLKDHPSISLTINRAGPESAEGSPRISGLVVASSHIDEADINVLPVENDHVIAAVTRVSSVGHVHEVNGQAEVVLNSLETADDATRMLAALRLAADMLADQSLAVLCEAVSVDERGTPLAALLAHDDDAVVAFIRRQPGAYSHAVGTCRMGDLRDPESVVDALGEVHGAVNLWVADASVFPDIPRAATQVPVMAVASRIARGVGERLL